MLLPRPISRLLLALALLVLGACSLTRVAYDHAPPILAWMVDDYFDLTGEQRGWVQERFERAVAWHRAQELPEYRRFLETVLERSGDGVSLEDARWAYGDVRAYYRRMLERLLPDIAEFLARLDPGQVGALEKRFAEDNAKIAKERVGADTHLAERRAKRDIERLEDWTGRLSASQRDFVATQSAALEDLTAYRLEDRRRRQAQLIEILRARPPREAAIARVRQLLVEPESWRVPAYAEKLKARDERYLAMVAALDATLSPEQRAHFARRVRGYLGDVNALAAKASP